MRCFLRLTARTHEETRRCGERREKRTAEDLPENKFILLFEKREFSDENEIDYVTR